MAINSWRPNEGLIHHSDRGVQYSDFFVLDNKAYIIVTEKVRQIFLDLKVTNVEITPIEEYQVDIETLSIGKPELYKYFMEKLSTNK